MPAPSPPSPPPTRAFVFAGGGTGGHLYPGLAIAEQLHERSGGRCEFLFLCSDRAVDRNVLSAAAVGGRAARFQPLAARPFGVRPGALLAFLRGARSSMRATRVALAEVAAALEPAPAGAGPRVTLVAMGGFVAPPAAAAAARAGLPVVLVNLDAAPGKANRLVARRAGRVFTSLPVAAPYAAGWTVVPPIVRAGAAAQGDAAACRRGLGLDPDRPTLLVTGGSLGAASINAFVLAFVERHGAALREHGWQVLHQFGGAGGGAQGGPDDAAAAARVYAGAGVPARVERFVGAMGLWWGAADLAISRAGAGSVAEAWCNRAPTLFLPYPHHADEHQRLNAAVLVEAGGAVLARDAIDAAANLAAHGPTLAALLTDAPRRGAMRAGLLRLGPADGAARIAAALLGLA